MNEIIGANRRNVYIGARQKKQVQRAIVLQILPQVRSVEKPMRGKVLAKVRFFEPNERRDEDNVISGLKFIMDALLDIEPLETALLMNGKNASKGKLNTRRGSRVYFERFTSNEEVRAKYPSPATDEYVKFLKGEK